MVAAIVIIAIIVGVVGYSYYTPTSSTQRIIKIGVATPLSGPSAYAGGQQEKGAELAAEEINAAGGVKLNDGNYTIQVVVGDDESNPAVGVSVFERFVTEDHVDIVIGEVNTAVTLAMMDVSAKYHVPYISLGSATDTITTKFMSNSTKYKYYFKMNVLSAEGWSQSSLQFLNYGMSKNWLNITQKNIAILGDDSDYGTGNSHAFAQAAQQAGWNVVDAETFKSDQQDFTSVLIRVKASGAQVLWTITTNPAAAASLTKQFVASGTKAYFMGMFIESQPPYKAAAGPISNGVIFGNLNIWSDRDPTVAAFMTKYKAKWGEESVSNAADGYDAVMLSKAAWEAAGTRDPDQFVNAMFANKVQGVLGYYVWEDNHCPEYGLDRIPASFAQIQWTNATSYHDEYLWPGQYFGDAVFQTPAWLTS